MKIANAAHCDCEDMGDSSPRNRYRRPRGSSARSSLCEYVPRRGRSELRPRRLGRPGMTTITSPEADRNRLCAADKQLEDATAQRGEISNSIVWFGVRRPAMIVPNASPLFLRLCGKRVDIVQPADSVSWRLRQCLKLLQSHEQRPWTSCR